MEISEELLNDGSLFSPQVLVTRLTEKGFLLLLSSVQMATTTGMTGTMYRDDQHDTEVIMCKRNVVACIYRARRELEEMSSGPVRLSRDQRCGQIWWVTRDCWLDGWVMSQS